MIRYLGHKGVPLALVAPCQDCGLVRHHAETCPQFRMMQRCLDNDCRTRTGVHTADCSLDMSPLAMHDFSPPEAP